MADINLLPDELKKREKEALEKTKKAKSDSAPKLTVPENGSEGREASAWHKLKGISEKTGQKQSVSPLGEAAEALMSSKSGDASPNYLQDKGKGGVRGKEKNAKPDTLEDILGEIETPEEKQAKELRQKFQIKLEKEKKEKAPNILIEEGTGEKDDSFVHKLKNRIQSIESRVGQLTQRAEPDELEVNLMPERVASLEEANWKKIASVLLGTLFLAALIIALGYMSIFFRIQKKEQELTELELSVTAMENEVRVLEDDVTNALDIHARISKVDELINNHVYWSNVLNKLEEYTLNNITLTKINGLSGTSITLQGETDTIETIIEQREFLRSATEFINGVLIQSYAPSAEGYIFELFISPKPDVWKKS